MSAQRDDHSVVADCSAEFFTPRVNSLRHHHETFSTRSKAGVCSLHDRTIVVGVLHLGNVYDSFSLGIFQVPRFIVQRDIAKIDGDLSHNVLGIWTRVQYFPQVSLRESSPRSLPHGPATYATLETKLHPSDSHKWKIEFSSVLSCSRCLCWYFFSICPLPDSIFLGATGHV